ncbi:ABC transporter permease [Microbulbifer sp. THAF38]|uniref:ABC transporter permease n=1 Tax=Microbulbifer sp. THAF38 TaxID=2587856 RepID=UPI0012682BB8|nr:ABC transporter permease [Microbulbifer sp. THAF38]QFT53800.1 Polysialic acid transport protein KpsM [Microbulbifer sp. THAF38]
MRPSPTRTIWQIQRDVIYALLVREMKTRFGKWRLGYAWALLEPALHIMMLAAIFNFLKRDFYPGIPTTLFMLGGIAPFLFFSHCFYKGIAAVASNRGLFNYRQLRPFDAVLSRVLLEFSIYILCMITLLILLAWFGIRVEFGDFLLLVEVNILFFFFCFGLSLALCVAGERYPELSKILPLIVRPLYFVSGVFFSLEQIPVEYHPYLIWNPLVHVIELTREGLYANYDGKFSNFNYYIFTSIGTLTLGLLIYRAHWRDLIRSQ